MLKRNKVLVAFMLVAVLCMSIGFASLTDTLAANGVLTLTVPGEQGPTDPDDPIVKNFDEDIFFSEVAAPAVTGNAVASNVKTQLSSDKDTITITIADKTFTNADETVTIVATIQNTATYAVTLAAPTTSNNDVHFTVTPTLAATTIAAGETTTLTITVELDAIPANNIDNAQFSVSVVATPAS